MDETEEKKPSEEVIKENEIDIENPTQEDINEWQKLQKLMIEQHQELMEALAKTEAQPIAETELEITPMEAEVLSSPTLTEVKEKSDEHDVPKNRSHKTIRMERKEHRKATR